MLCPFGHESDRWLKCAIGCAWYTGNGCAMVQAAAALSKLAADTDTIATATQALGIVNEYALGIATKDEAAQTITNL